MLEGVLIAESLRVGAELSGIPLQVTKMAREEADNTADGNRGSGLSLDIAADEADAGRLAVRLAACLDPAGGW